MADPPWHYDDQAGRMTLDYPTMTDDAIVRLPVGQCAAEAAHLWLWTTDAHLPVALRSMAAWGFDLKRTVPWVKTLDDPAELAGQIVEASEAGDVARVRRLSERIGRVRIGGGHWLRGAHELCLFGVRGGLHAQAHDIPTVLMAPRTERHSEKPEAFVRMVERLSPGPRLELFGRVARPNWDVWGNQAPTGQVTQTPVMPLR